MYQGWQVQGHKKTVNVLKEKGKRAYPAAMAMSHWPVFREPVKQHTAFVTKEIPHQIREV